MSTIFRTLVDDADSIFGLFICVYLFGSALYDDNPNDVDILLIYDKKNIHLVGPEKKRLVNILSARLRGLPINFTTLTVSELAQVGFLDRITYRCIKCDGNRNAGI